MEMKDEKLLTVPEVAKMYGVTRAAVYNWINEGKLPAVKVGALVRIQEGAAREFIRPYEPTSKAAGRVSVTAA